MANVAIIGTGYVGLCTGAILADLGNQVFCVDIDRAKIAILQGGDCPIYEPGLDELLARNVAAGRIAFTYDYDEAVSSADFVFICVNTPARAHGGADMTYVSSAARSLGHTLARSRYTVVVNKSTMPIGSGDLVHALLAESCASAEHFAVVANPEFLREGSAVHDALHPDRIVLGASDRAAAERVAELYRPIKAPILFTDLRTAEMIKYASNAFLATRISFINEVAHICESLGADVRQVAEGMGLDKRIGPYFLNAGVGFGGSCFPKDVAALEFMAADADCHPQLLRAVLDINRDGRRRFVRKLQQLLGTLTGKTVAVWGLAFKPDTDDLRDSPAIDIIRDLLARGVTVRACDPVAVDEARALVPDAIFCTDPYEAATGADAVALVTEWDEFKGIDLDRVRRSMRQPILIDGRNLYDPEEVAALGFTYRGIGIPPIPANNSKMAGYGSASAAPDSSQTRLRR